jgi:hypothetical protein
LQHLMGRICRFDINFDLGENDSVHAATLQV